MKSQPLSLLVSGSSAVSDYKTETHGNATVVLIQLRCTSLPGTHATQRPRARHSLRLITGERKLQCIGPRSTTFKPTGRAHLSGSSLGHDRVDCARMTGGRRGGGGQRHFIHSARRITIITSTITTGTTIPTIMPPDISFITANITETFPNSHYDTAQSCTQ